MKSFRLVGLMLVAFMVVGLVVVSVASAAGPLFLPTGAAVTGTSGTFIVASSEDTITCAKDVWSGGRSPVRR